MYTRGNEFTIINDENTMLIVFPKVQYTSRLQYEYVKGGLSLKIK